MVSVNSNMCFQFRASLIDERKNNVEAKVRKKIPGPRNSALSPVIPTHFPYAAPYFHYLCIEMIHGKSYHQEKFVVAFTEMICYIFIPNLPSNIFDLSSYENLFAFLENTVYGSGVRCPENIKREKRICEFFSISIF